jgi:DNA-directed RNA polymerase sigma subunit (sigma70/sigma32)
MKIINAASYDTKRGKGEITIITSDKYEALDTISQLQILKNLINDLRSIYSDKLKEHRVVKPKTRYVEVTERENKVMYLRMEGRTLQAVGDIMGVSKERIRQILSKHQRRCKKESQILTTLEINGLLPHIEEIKALYESQE